VLVDCADMVDFTIVLIRDGHENVVLPAKCPGRKPLVEYVRPLLIPILDLRSVDHGQRIVIQLNVGAGVEADWSWPAERVAVSFYRASVQFCLSVRPSVTFRYSINS